jgi:hypothetical protein
MEGPVEEYGSRVDAEPPFGTQYAPHTIYHTIALHIEELILHGFAPADRNGIAAAIERELARLFAEQGMPPSLGQDDDMVQLEGGSFKLVPGSRPDAIGAQVARAIYRGMK